MFLDHRQGGWVQRVAAVRKQFVAKNFEPEFLGSAREVFATAVLVHSFPGLRAAQLVTGFKQHLIGRRYATELAEDPRFGAAVGFDAVGGINDFEA